VAGTGHFRVWAGRRPFTTLAVEDPPLRRLFSSFADGWPGAGLFFLRLVAGIALIAFTIAGFHTDAPAGALVSGSLGAVAGLLLIIGLWTPIAGSLVAIVGVWNAIAGRGDLWVNLLLATMGAALAVLGPGAWSIDARLFGWKRIDIPDSTRR